MGKTGCRMAVIFFFLLGVFLISSEPFAQTILNVRITGTMFDRHEPPGPPVAVSGRAKISLSSTSEPGFNVLIIPDDPGSILFNTFQFPGASIQENLYAFFGTVQNKKVAADLLVFSGKINSSGGPTDILYVGSFDNPVIFFSPQFTGFPGTAPIFSWDFINDGTAGDSDNFACEEADGPIPGEPGFIVLIERGGGCLFFEKLRNASKAGAVAAIIYNHEEGGDTFIPGMFTPTSDIPGVFIKHSDGLSLLSYADNNIEVPGTVELLPTNLMGMIGGTFSTDSKGVLKNVSLAIMLSDQDDHIFVGTVRK